MKIEKKKLRKWNNIIHRDLGYFFFALTVIYGLSGIALNHKVIDKWNADYIVTKQDFKTDIQFEKGATDNEQVKSLLNKFGEADNIKKFYFPDKDKLRIFLEEGLVVVNTNTGVGYIELAKKRPIFNDVNFLHYNPNRVWTYISDIYAGALIILAITGLFVIRGRKGIKWRGTIIAILGLLIPIVFLIIYR